MPLSLHDVLTQALFTFVFYTPAIVLANYLTTRAMRRNPTWNQKHVFLWFLIGIGMPAIFLAQFLWHSWSKR